MVTPGKNRFSSSVMVEIGEKIYIVDAGAPVSEMLFQRGISFDKVKTIFITHCHSGHVNGLPFFASLADSHVFPDCHTGIYIPDDFPAIAFEKHFDCIVSECAHATVEGFEKNLLRFDSDKVIVTHVFPDSKFCELENLKDVKGNNVIIANDNDEINI